MSNDFKNLERKSLSLSLSQRIRETTKMMLCFAFMSSQIVRFSSLPFFLFLLLDRVCSQTDPGDLSVLHEFYSGLSNPSLLKWPLFNTTSDPCGAGWDHVVCNGHGRVSQIQVANLGLEGTLPTRFNSLSELTNLGLQRNSFNGPLPTFRGLAKLQYAYLGGNRFDSIPSDFFDGLTSLQVISLEQNQLNQSTGWSLPTSLKSSSQLQNLSLSGCNLVGLIPDFLGSLPSLAVLELSYNSLSGTIPTSLGGSQLRSFTLNNQNGPGVSGPIDVVATMTSLVQLWLHGNQFSGVIPPGIVNCVSLVDVRLSHNQLVGPIPPAMTSLTSLRVLWLDHNMLTGPIPAFNFANFTYAENSFCQPTPGKPCSEAVSALLEFLGNASFPISLAGQWSGNDPCGGSWLGVSCSNGTVTILNLPDRNLNGTISSSLAKISSFVKILLGNNNLEGVIPPELTGLKYLRVLNLSSNNLGPPVPTFSNAVAVLIDGNPLLAPNSGRGGSPTSPSGHTASSGTSSTSSGRAGSKKVTVIIVVVGLASLFFLLIPVVVIAIRKKKRNPLFLVHPRDLSDSHKKAAKISMNANNSDATPSSMSLHMPNRNADGLHLTETGNLLISVQILRCVTGDFATENEVGRGGFGVVYKGTFDDGTIIAVKRMESTVISNKALEEFQSEIAVLSSVRHRHLVSLLGYCVEGNERMLVYEYMSQGALSKHLFQWRKLNLQPLSWKRRLNIALDVARGLEYLHNMAHQSFIHRDLKSSNILLGDDFRAKISDFGLVKLAPDGQTSVATRLAGTFGYLAPEYAVTGKITTKADVFSFGVVLMELLTGLTALDHRRPEESRYLMAYFWTIKLNKESLAANLDTALDVKEDAMESILVVSELARHCTSRDPSLRPDMGHAVNVLSPLVEKWKPTNEEEDELEGITYDRPLLQMVKGWQDDEEVGEQSFAESDDSHPSLPSRPNGFAESFASINCR